MKNDIMEAVCVVFVCVLLVSFSYAVIDTASNIRENVNKDIKDIKHLPSECEKYYEDGTDNWKDCMGVGYK